MTADEECELVRRWQQHGDEAARTRLVTANLGMVHKVARAYRKNRLAYGDLTQEGAVGLLDAIDRFEPARGLKLSTYAVWWIRARIQSAVRADLSLVRFGRNRDEQRAFVALRGMRHRREALGLPVDDASIAAAANVPLKKLTTLEARLNGDAYLGAPVFNHTLADELVDGKVDPETATVEKLEREAFHRRLRRAMKDLDKRERDIIRRRFLREEVATLGDVAKHYGVCRERIRQIEARALAKLREAFGVGV